MLRFGVIAGILILAIVVKFIGDLQPLHIKTDITELPPGVQEWHKKGIPSSPPFSFFFPIIIFERIHLSSDIQLIDFFQNNGQCEI